MAMNLRNYGRIGSPHLGISSVAVAATTVGYVGLLSQQGPLNGFDARIAFVLALLIGSAILGLMRKQVGHQVGTPIQPRMLVAQHHSAERISGSGVLQKTCAPRRQCLGIAWPDRVDNLAAELVDVKLLPAVGTRKVDAPHYEVWAYLRCR